MEVVCTALVSTVAYYRFIDVPNRTIQSKTGHKSSFICFGYIIPWMWATTKTCYEGYGCFSVEAPFTNSRGYLPRTPEELDVSLELHTRFGNSLIDPKTNSNGTFFDKNKKIKIIIHGFLGSESLPWVQRMTTELLNKEDSNVFVVNWEKGADECNYYQAVANSRMVAAVVSKYLKLLLDTYTINASSVHSIGASLGAHICAYIGQSVNGIGRITGLDPASYGFESFGDEVSLSPTDASFVDVIHTNKEYGFSKSVGDVDFYVNGGSWQPGCSWLYSNTCSHSRAFELFIESINSSCLLLSFPCDLNRVQLGGDSCTTCGVKGCSYMGFNAPTNKFGVYHTSTNNEKPYC